MAGRALTFEAVSSMSSPCGRAAAVFPALSKHARKEPEPKLVVERRDPGSFRNRPLTMSANERRPVRNITSGPRRCEAPSKNRARVVRTLLMSSLICRDRIARLIPCQ